MVGDIVGGAYWTYCGLMSAHDTAVARGDEVLCAALSAVCHNQLCDCMENLSNRSRHFLGAGDTRVDFFRPYVAPFDFIKT